MSKLTPMILAVLMLASTSLVALDWSELENNSMTEADGRTGPDAQVTSILSPRATTTDSITGEQLHTLKAGEDVHFETYIENVGDSAISEMGITVTVYLAENGARGMIAKDSAGNDLSWNNGDVVCDDSFVCPWSSIGAGELLDYGKYTMSYQGSPVVWTPNTGDYVVVVETNAFGDADPGNDYSENLVSVVDWTDIIVDLSWDSGKEVEGGGGDKAFTLSVEAGGSSAWSARNITLQLDVMGTLEAATAQSDGADIMGSNTFAEFGTYGMAEVFRHQEDETNVTNDSRYTISYEPGVTDTAEWFGTLSPDMSGDSGEYSVTVSLVSYVVYGQLPECTETVAGNSSSQEGGESEITYVHYCEVTFYQDGDAATSEDTIEGKVQTFHDIGITNLVINQGYVVDENGVAQSPPTMPGITEGPLNPAWSSVQASVRHLGSDLFVTYDWKVTFDIKNTGTGVTETIEADSCVNGNGPDYQHMELGDDMGMGGAFEMGEACAMFNFAPGIYNVTATISMVGETVTDMSARNDDASIYEIAALNNRPAVSLTVEQDEGSIVIGPEGFITIVADADDADDDAGMMLNYIWTHPGMISINGTVQPSACNGMGPEFSTCQLIAFDAEWAGVQTYSVRVNDEYGSYAQDFENIFVWNKIVATDSTDSGIGMEYDLTYDGANPFTISLTDSEQTYTKDLTEFGYSGEYNSVAVIDYSPVTTYMAEDVYAQTITMTYDASTLEPTSVFWVNNGNWAQLDATISASSSDGTIDIDWHGAGNQVLPQGEIVLMGGELQIIEAPEGHPMNLAVVASAGGDITASWSYMGTTVPGFDYLRMEICDSSDNCEVTNENTTLVGHSMDGQTDTVHGETYTYTLQVCNAGGCNPTIATGSATADKMVDGDASATSVSVANKEGANAWTVSWTASGDTSDVSGWMVCMANYAWSPAGMMPTEQCSDAGDATSMDINHPGGQGTVTYYFAVVAYDDKGNMNNAEPQTDILLEHSNEVVDPCEVDPDSEECATIGNTGDSADSGEVPTWTWGVIIGLVVVAFVVGAFILSRGGDGDEGKDWDY